MSRIASEVVSEIIAETFADVLSGYETDVQIDEHVEKFINRLKETEQGKFFRAVELLGSFGTRLQYPHTQHIRGKVWELRYKENKKWFRVLYFTPKRNQFVLLHIFQKQSNRTPAKEISTAEKRMEFYLNNM